MQYTERLSDKVNRMANGNWPGILVAAHIDERYLVNKHGPCPICNANRAFRFDNKNGRGTWICKNCNAGTGLDLLMKVTGRAFTEAAQWVLDHLGDPVKARPIADFSRKYQPQTETVDQAQEVAARRAAFRRVWSEANVVQQGDPVWLYLTGRLPGLKEVPKVIRFHPGLSYIGPSSVAGQRGRNYGRHPCMVSVVQADDGRVCNIHRTFLTVEGKKLELIDQDENGSAEMLPAKKLMPAVGEKSYAVRLTPHTGRLGVCEGIETGLAAWISEGVPTWALVATAGMKSFNVPQDVSELVIYADNDKRTARGTLPGFEAAQFLANRPDVMARVRARTLKVQMVTPSRRGQDMADMLVAAAKQQH